MLYVSTVIAFLVILFLSCLLSYGIMVKLYRSGNVGIIAIVLGVPIYQSGSKMIASLQLQFPVLSSWPWAVFFALLFATLLCVILVMYLIMLFHQLVYFLVFCGVIYQLFLLCKAVSIGAVTDYSSAMMLPLWPAVEIGALLAGAILGSEVFEGVWSAPSKSTGQGE